MNDELAVVETGASLAPALLFGSAKPAEIVARASEMAGVLADVVRQKGLSKVIESKEYVFVEGWTLLGSMLGVYPVVVSVEPVPGSAVPIERPAFEWQTVNGKRQRVQVGAEEFVGNDYRAHVEARTLAGALVGSGVALCTRSEAKWAKDAEYALCSMAQTRAVSKALRLPLGFVMKLAGFQATPGEEVPEGGFGAVVEPASPPSVRQAAPAPATSSAPAPASPPPSSPAPSGNPARPCPNPDCRKVRVYKLKTGAALQCVKDDSKGGGCWKKWKDEPAYQAALGALAALDSGIAPNPYADAMKEARQSVARVDASLEDPRASTDGEGYDMITDDQLPF